MLDEILLKFAMTYQCQMNVSFEKYYGIFYMYGCEVHVSNLSEAVMKVHRMLADLFR